MSESFDGLRDEGLSKYLHKEKFKLLISDCLIQSVCILDPEGYLSEKRYYFVSRHFPPQSY